MSASYPDSPSICRNGGNPRVSPFSLPESLLPGPLTWIRYMDDIRGWPERLTTLACRNLRETLLLMAHHADANGEIVCSMREITQGLGRFKPGQIHRTIQHARSYRYLDQLGVIEPMTTAYPTVDTLVRYRLGYWDHLGSMARYVAIPAIPSPDSLMKVKDWSWPRDPEALDREVGRAQP